VACVGSYAYKTRRFFGRLEMESRFRNGLEAKTFYCLFVRCSVVYQPYRMVEQAEQKLQELYGCRVEASEISL
jgi:hypothetical protein